MHRRFQPVTRTRGSRWVDTRELRILQAAGRDDFLVSLLRRGQVAQQYRYLASRGVRMWDSVCEILDDLESPTPCSNCTASV